MVENDYVRVTDGVVTTANRAGADSEMRFDGLFSLGFPRDELVRRRDRDDLEDAGQVLERAGIDAAPVAGDADRRALRPRDGVRLESVALDGLDDAADVLRGGHRVHDDEHAGAKIWVTTGPVKPDRESGPGGPRK